LEDRKIPSGGFLSLAFVTGLFSGYAPIAPGTAGSLVGLVIALIPGILEPEIIIPLTLVTFALGVYFSNRFSTATDPDPSFVVIDEVVGMWIALFLLPFTPLALFLSFIVFRLLDIVKPFPARRLEHLPGGWGIMTDDVVAAIYANVIVRIILKFI
jgi:phosphatidylglycerophosphatase A